MHLGDGDAETGDETTIEIDPETAKRDLSQEGRLNNPETYF